MLCQLVVVTQAPPSLVCLWQEGDVVFYQKDPAFAKNFKN